MGGGGSIAAMQKAYRENIRLGKRKKAMHNREEYVKTPNGTKPLKYKKMTVQERFEFDRDLKIWKRRKLRLTVIAYALGISVTGYAIYWVVGLF